ncbi:sensor histidine kinase [Streptomyces sp. NPDC096311]|uniref:sensor histidine kinase n=1 Tax=Streptomyces sp. NPDC096311 TaxID=3366083 RepID=UPI003820EA18
MRSALRDDMSPPPPGAVPSDGSAPGGGIDGGKGQERGGQPVLSRLVQAQHRRQAADRRRPWVLDTGLVLLVLLMGLPDLLVDPSGSAMFGVHPADVPLATLLLWQLALAVPLWWRRRSPSLTFAVIAAVCLAHWSLSVWLRTDVSLLIALYSLALHGRLRHLPVAAGLAATGLIAMIFRSGVYNPWVAAFLVLGTATAAAAIGLTLRIRRAHLAALEDRAARLQVEQEQRARLIAAAERSRVAREMHDIVGHNLAVIISLADGAENLVVTRPERSAEAMRIIAGTGRQALTELRRVLGVLRESSEEPQLEPQPGIGDLEPLMERVRAAGADVSFRTSGDLGGIADGVQLTVYRIVQEALTNSLKHAGPGTSINVAVEFGDDQVRVTVTDTGPAPGRTPAIQPAGLRQGDGHGIVGMRERTGLYRGSLTSGPGARGGWVTTAVLNEAGAPLPPASPDGLRSVPR